MLQESNVYDMKFLQRKSSELKTGLLVHVDIVNYVTSANRIERCVWFTDVRKMSKICSFLVIF